jgi:intracellular multiplication protein IcmJ
MRLTPLTLSVCENGEGGGKHRGSCPFCGVRLDKGREPFPCIDGSEESSCVPCFLVRHLERETIAEEAVLIWLPDLSQAALNALANGVHRRLAGEGALYLAASPFAVSSSEIPNPALEAIRAIEMRRAEAERRFGTSSPRVLGEALMRARPNLYADRARRLGGLRLWPRGKFFVDGEDVYPRLIAGGAAA